MAMKPNGKSIVSAGKSPVAMYFKGDLYVLGSGQDVTWCTSDSNLMSSRLNVRTCVHIWFGKMKSGFVAKNE